MSNNLLFITMVAMILFNVSAYVLIMVRFTETQHQIEDIADTQFDAEKVMEIYNMKFNRPIVYEDKKQIRELYETIELTWEQYHMIKDNDDFDAYIKRELADLYAERIMPFVDIVVDSNYARNTEIIKARLKVVEKGTKTDDRFKRL